jgi:hypothetical protein
MGNDEETDKIEVYGTSEDIWRRLKLASFAHPICLNRIEMLRCNLILLKKPYDD